MSRNFTPCKFSVDTSGVQRAVPDEGYTSRIVRRFEEFALVVRDEKGRLMIAPGKGREIFSE